MTITGEVDGGFAATNEGSFGLVLIGGGILSRGESDGGGARSDAMGGGGSGSDSVASLGNTF